MRGSACDLRCAPNRTKRAFDVVLAGCGLVLLSPVLVVLGLAVRLDSPGPVLFRGERIGRGKAPFRMLKFRTMTHVTAGAADRIAASNQDRITRLGRHLRRTKLDELPQLVNVLWGDMSLVGPRPEGFRYLPHYHGEELDVFTARPGITGLAQLLIDEEAILSERNEPEDAYVVEVLPRKLQLDLRYLRGWSVAVDVEIVFCTLIRLIGGSVVVPTPFGALRRLLQPEGRIA